MVSLCRVKTCTTCHLAKPLDAFHRQVRRPDGRASRCRECYRTVEAKPRQPLAARFWAKVDRNGPTQPHMDTCCWQWTASTTGNGYGHLRLGRSGRLVIASRLAWEMTHGPIEDSRDDFHGICVLHRCDNRRCVRPDHLFLGDHTANMRDKVAKGRDVPPPSLRGEQHPDAKVTADIVRELRRRHDSGEPVKAIADCFGLTIQHAWKIAKRLAWRHVT